MIQSHERIIKPFAAAEGLLGWLCPNKVTLHNFSCLPQVILHNLAKSCEKALTIEKKGPLCSTYKVLLLCVRQVNLKIPINSSLRQAGIAQAPEHFLDLTSPASQFAKFQLRI
jgi:hypothetical protein